MINSEKNIFVQETEIKPNKYAFIVMLVTLAGIISCWILNEVGIFRVGAFEMRVGTFVSFIFVAIPAIIFGLDKRMYANPKMKYLIVTSVTVFTFFNTTMMTFHTTILLIFPISIAMLYRSKQLGIFAMLGSMLCTILSPIAGYMLGTWDIAFLEELILIGTGGTAHVIDPTYIATITGVLKIALYIVLPRAILIGSFSVLMFHVIKLGVDHVNNQILLNTISHRDALTGLYNQNYYKELILKIDDVEDVGVIFFDVNYLKTINDTQGHEAGDLLLKRCAESLLKVCTETTTAPFRIGGDEFLLIMEGAKEEDVLKKLESWKHSLAEINEENLEIYEGLECSMAYGYAVGSFKNIIELVTRADASMYKNKAEMKTKIN